MFLLGLQLSHLTPLFHQHKVEFGQLLSMTDSDLQLVGVAQVGCRKKILNGVLEVHKREWSMPDSQLPFGRPIRWVWLEVWPMVLLKFLMGLAIQILGFVFPVQQN